MNNKRKELIDLLKSVDGSPYFSTDWIVYNIFSTKDKATKRKIKIEKILK